MDEWADGWLDREMDADRCMHRERGEDGGMNGKVDSRMGGQSETQIERQGWTARVWEGSQNLAEWSEGATHAVPIEDIGQVIRSQLNVWPQLWPRPAHSHLASGDCLELEVPAATLHHIGFLCPEDAHPVPARLALHLTCTWGQAE